MTLLSAEHSWIQNAKKAPNVSLGETVKARLKQFSVMNKLKKRALRVFCLALQLLHDLISVGFEEIMRNFFFHFLSGDSRTLISGGSSWHQGSI